MTKSALDAWFSANRATILADYFTLLRFPSIGGDPAHLSDCVACADWICAFLRPLGFTAELVRGDGSKPPLVLAERPADNSGRTVLLYGHYDVQPVDPVDLWETQPFAPTEREGRVYARGAQDDKGHNARRYNRAGPGPGRRRLYVRPERGGAARRQRRGLRLL